MGDTSNIPLYRPFGTLVSMGRKVVKAGELDLRNINRRLRGEVIPHRCTCATDHGWHP